MKLNPKNIQEFVVKNVIEHLYSNEDYELLEKLKKNKKLKSFVSRVNPEKFNDVVDFYTYSLDCHDNHFCEKHNKTYSYRDDSDERWHSGDTEFFYKYEAKNLLAPPNKILPCCREQEYLNDDDDAEESIE